VVPKIPIEIKITISSVIGKICDQSGFFKEINSCKKLDINEPNRKKTVKRKKVIAVAKSCLIISSTKKDLYSKFKFNPLVKQSDDFNYRSKSGSFDYSDIPIDEILYNGQLWCKDGDKVSYNWEKNGKTIQLDITVVQKNKLLTLLMGYTIAITIIKE